MCVRAGYFRGCNIPKGYVLASSHQNVSQKALVENRDAGGSSGNGQRDGEGGQPEFPWGGDCCGIVVEGLPLAATK